MPPEPFDETGGVPDLSELDRAFHDEDPPEPGTEPPVPSEGQPPASEPPPPPQPTPPGTQPVPPAGQPPTPEPTPPTPTQPDLGIPPELSQPPVPEPQPGEEPPAPQPGEEGHLYAGRFRTVPEVEAGYLQARRLHENTARERNAQQIRAEQAIELARRLYPYYQQHIQGQQQPRQSGQPDVPDGLDPEFAKAVQPWIDQRVQTQLGDFRQRLTQEQVQQQEAQRQEQEIRAEREAASQAITAFESQVPLDEPGRLALADSFKELDLASKAFDGTPLAITLENLTVAHEASKSPALLRQLRVMPHLMDTEDGMAFAREQATLPPRAPSAPAPAGPSATPGPQAPSTRTSELRAARVEEGGPLPPGEEREIPEDPWQDVLELHRRDGGRVSPILGV